MGFIWSFTGRHSDEPSHWPTRKNRRLQGHRNGGPRLAIALHRQSARRSSNYPFWYRPIVDIRKPVVGAAPSVLIIGGAGGVSSIAIQLVRALTDLTVVATASRPETRSWVKNLGAHHVIDHGKPIAEQVAGAVEGASTTGAAAGTSLASESPPPLRGPRPHRSRPR
jgi:hypothetical protein